MRMRNSPTKPLRPGTAIDDIITTVNTAANTGATFCSPLSAEISRVCRRSTMKPTRRKRAPVLRPWLIICRTPPVSDCRVSANVPRTMKPRWATEE